MASKYYLKVGEKIVDFKKASDLPKIDDFLMLSIFTGLFEDKQELIKNLIALGLISPTGDYSNTEIVKHSGNKTNGYDITFVTDEIIYKRAMTFFSEGAINTFLYTNRRNYEAISELFEGYYKRLANLVTIFLNKIANLIKESETLTDSLEKKEILAKIERKRNSLEYFNSQYANIGAILALLKIINMPNYIVNKEVEYEYIQRLNAFIRGECNYIIGHSIKSKNYRGIAHLAYEIDKLLIKYPYLDVNYVACSLKQRKILLEALRKTLKAKQQEKNNRQSNYDSPNDADPDSYMFLDNSDFYRTLSLNASPEEQRSVQVAIENLSALKERFRK